MLVNDDVNLLVEFVVMSAFIRSLQDNYYTIIPVINVLFCDAVDYSIQTCHVGTDDYLHR